ncbi:MAG TPA: L-threonylcarbamoyladenylate synthase, partial [Patescibacteria group bacterium]|nr:L-threonylcarbamoyladenylate synthase [Patescibacteria group bacterium]
MQILDLQRTSESDAVCTAVAVLQSGGLVVYPTETTYGIGADVTNQSAIDALLAYKTKRDGKPLSVMVQDQRMAERYVVLNESAKKVYRQFLPGPVTVVSTAKELLAKGVVSAMNTVGIRISSYPLVTAIVAAFGKPITATGANASYKKRPYSVQDILDHLTEKQKGMIDLIIDAGELPHNEPSTVIDTTLDNIEVLRQGTISFADKTTYETHSDKETQELGKKLVSKY